MLRRLGLEVQAKNVYWWLRSVLHGIESKKINGITAKFESYSIPRYEEEPVVADLLDHLHEGDVFYDIGADRGWYSCFVASFNSDISVLAFEPHPARRRVLKRNLSLNLWDDSEIMVRSEGWSDVEKKAQFAYQIQLDENIGEFEAQLVCGDDIIERKDLPRPTVLKIDVEGAEQLAIEGCEDAIKHESCRLIYLEIHEALPQYGGSKGQLRKLISNAGFEITEIHCRGEQSFWRAEKL